MAKIFLTRKVKIGKTTFIATYLDASGPFFLQDSQHLRVLEHMLKICEL